MKRTLSVILAALMLAGVLFAMPLTAGAEAPFRFAAEPFGNENASVSLWKNDADGAYYLFLPGGTDTSAVTVRCTRSTAVDGAYLSDGAATDLLTAGRHTLTVAGTDYTLFVFVSGDLPSVFLTTESGSMNAINADKSHKEKGTITVVENGAVTIDAAALSSVKGRGNSTWNNPKKPYNIKFDKKTDLFGMGKAKKWSFLANWADDTLARNRLAFDLADRFGIAYTSRRTSVDLYANGEYLGSYLVCESVEVGSNRVEIADLASMNEDANPDVDDIEALPQGGTGAGNKPEDGTHLGSMRWTNIPNDPADITGGYLLEMDFRNRYEEEVSGFVSNRGQCVTIKAPEFASEAEVRYIAGYWNEMEDALWSPNGVNGRGKHYSEYLDVDAMARAYLLEELTMDLDAGMTSFYFCKDVDGKLAAAPVWDFDLSLGTYGTREGADMTDPGFWYANSLSNSSFGLGAYDIETVLTLFFKHESNRSAAAQAWNGSTVARNAGQVAAGLDADLAMLEDSFVMDAIRWSKGTFADEARIHSGYKAAGTALRTFITERIDALDQAFSAPVAMLYYDGNGVSGHVFNREIVHRGDSVTVLPDYVDGMSKLRTPDDRRFTGWNTKADGSGTAYAPGDRIALNDATTTLYAQFEPTGKICPYDGKVHTGALSGLVYFFHRIFAFFRDLFR